MTDLRFDDVVETTRMRGRDGKYVTSTCKTCSKQQRVKREEFRYEDIYTLDGEKAMPIGVDDEMLEYVAAMRAWRCCHEGEEPLDGFPEEPEPPAGIEWGP